VDVPVEHLDYDYVGKCTDSKELVAILQVLRSGKEGRYAHLEHFVEERLLDVLPPAQRTYVSSLILSWRVLEACCLPAAAPVTATGRLLRDRALLLPCCHPQFIAEHVGTESDRPKRCVSWSRRVGHGRCVFSPGEPCFTPAPHTPQKRGAPHASRP
jgi:hypothetical protein